MNQKALRWLIATSLIWCGGTDAEHAALSMAARAPVAAPFVLPLPTLPPRTLSSTLKMAMAELGRTTPGQRMAMSLADEVNISASRTWGARVRPLPVFAMSKELGAMAWPGGVALASSSGVTPPAVPAVPPDALTMRLASAR